MSDRYSFKINKNKFKNDEGKDRFAKFRPQALKLDALNMNIKEYQNIGWEYSPESMTILSPLNNKKSKYMRVDPNDDS